MESSLARSILAVWLVCISTGGLLLGAGHLDLVHARHSRPSAPPASAGGPRSLDCPRGLVSLGASPADVRERCGEPSRRGAQIWVYDMGGDSLVRILRFERGRLAEIRHGPYGK